MTHLIQTTDEGYFTINNPEMKILFSNQEKYKEGDTIIVQNGRDEAYYQISSKLSSSSSLKKGYSINILSEK